jgi:hypothetical protein
MSKKQIPQHPDGWKFKGGAGRFKVWHAGKNDYRVTDDWTGPEVANREQFGEAWSFACRRYEALAFSK